MNLHTRSAEHRVGQMVGDIITTPQEVHDQKIALDTQMTTTNRQWEAVTLGSAANNPQFSPTAAQDAFAWTAFFNSWNSFVLEDSSLLTASSDLARVQDFASQLKDWQTRLVQDTAADGQKTTIIQQAQAPTQGQGALGGAAHTIAQAEADALGTLIRPVAEIVGLGLLIYFGWEFLPPIVSSLKARYA